MAEETGTTVQLYIYDLTNGFASILAPAIIGKLKIKRNLIRIY